MKPGQDFEARGQSDARLLVAIGHAMRGYPQETVESETAAQYHPEQSAQPEEQPEISARTGKPKRVYRRKDMVAE